MIPIDIDRFEIIDNDIDRSNIWLIFKSGLIILIDLMKKLTDSDVCGWFDVKISTWTSFDVIDGFKIDISPVFVAII